MPTENDSNGTSRILTLVFTDLADSTALKTRRGDQAVGELISRHRTQVQRLAAESGLKASRRSQRPPRVKRPRRCGLRV